MLTIIRSFIYATTISLLLACQSTAKKPIVPMPGMPLSRLIDTYGQPASQNQVNGLLRYTWQLSSARLDNSSFKRSKTSISSSGTITSGTNTMPQMIRIFCQLQVTTHSDGQVQDWQANGDGCQQILLNKI